MTNEEKARITELRSQGCTYAKISEMLTISEGTIKTYCRRERLVNKPDEATPVCKKCSQPLVLKDKHRPRQFCSDKCRAAWWYANHSNVPKTEYHLTCANCGQPFVSVGNRSRKYCAHQCYISARFGGGGHE